MKLLQNDFLTFRHLGENQEKDIADISSFEVIHPEIAQGLENYLKQQALQDEREGLMRTYLVHLRDRKECVGYFSLKAGLVSVNEISDQDTVFFDTLPGVELANFALNHNFTQKYDVEGLGNILFERIIVPLVQQLSNSLGIYLIYLYALPIERLIKNYEKYGFRRLPADAEEQLHRRIKPAYDHSCIFMYKLLHETAYNRLELLSG